MSSCLLKFVVDDKRIVACVTLPKDLPTIGILPTVPEVHSARFNAVISFRPQVGHEQAGYRPALVLSPESYNRKVGLALLCPITRQIKEYPFEVKVPDGLKVSGVVLSDQIKSLDWRARKASPLGTVPESCVREVLRKVATLLSV